MKSHIFLLLFLFIGFVPYFDSIDIIGPQWLYLSFLNIPLLIFNYKLVNRFILDIFSFKPLIYYLLFVIFCFLSLFYSNNILISIIDLSRITITFLSVINLIVLFSNTTFNFNLFSLLISITLLFEILYSFYPLFDFLIANSFSSVDFTSVPTALKGVAGNKNVLAADIAFKIPFVLYLIFNTKNFLKYLYSILLSFAFLNILLLSSRAAFISTFLVSAVFLFYFIINRKFWNLHFFISLIFPFIFIFSVNYFLSTTNSATIQSRVTSISSADESASHRIVLYENAIDYISKNPFIGCGIGNWKVESLPYWKTKLSGYTIPYHAHNDFLELTTEIGVFGGFFYILIFLALFYYSIVFIRRNNISGYLLFSISVVYFIDASLNFPLERALSQVNFMVMLISAYFLISNNEKQYF